jgi:hypothetical protein
MRGNIFGSNKTKKINFYYNVDGFLTNSALEDLPMPNMKFTHVSFLPVKISLKKHLLQLMKMALNYVCIYI